MKSWILLFKNMFNFKSECSVKEYFVTVLIWCISLVILSAIIAYNQDLVYLLFIYLIISILPFLALGARRLNNAQRSRLNLFWLLIPIFGWFVLFLALISKSRADRDREFDRYHW